MSSEIAIRVQNLSKCYRIYDNPQDRLKECILPRIQKLVGKNPKGYGRDFWALKDASLEISKGETVGIIGRNGSGKSTLLQMICGTLTPTSGTVEVRGRVAALLELGAGFHPEFTGRENVYMNGALLGLTDMEIDERFDDIAAFADIGRLIDQPVKTYSSGMYVRLAFAVVAHVNADILVVDEALAVGDAFFVQKCMRYLRRFMMQGTVLFVSHDAGAVLNLCGKAVLLEHGSIKSVGPAKYICDQYLQLLYESQQTQQTEALELGSESTSSVKEDDAFNRVQPGDKEDSISAESQAKRQMFGTGKALVEDVTLRAEDGRSVRRVSKREKLVLAVTCRTSIRIFSPIVGFVVRDRLGQTLFGQNTYLAHAEKPILIETDTIFKVEFEFWMPLLQQGDYSISVALAEGTQEEHVQHHWLHDALVFHSSPSEPCFGPVGIETVSIQIHSLDPRETKHERVIGSSTL
ncbi:MAG: ABC transporter ATP-binding protein [Nitrospirota bacterium]